MKPQTTRMKGDRDCSVWVFSQLTGLSEEEIITDLPGAPRGEVTVDEWCAWLKRRGYEYVRRTGCPGDIVPCAHLVANTPEATDAHWVFRDEHGDVYDPGGGYVPANDDRMRNLIYWSEKRATISVPTK